MPSNTIKYNSDVARRLTKGYGSTTQPIYVKSDGTIGTCTELSSSSTWATARTFTIGATGKSVDGSANVSWSKAEILGSSTDANFYRGDQTWSNTLNGTFTANGTITANGGYLQSTAHSNTVTIGSQNSAFTHIYNSASIPFIFNNTIETTTGNLGSASYPWNNLYIGKANGAGIYYVGYKSALRMIRFIDNTGDIYGNGISIGGGGQTIIGGGESADTAAAQVGTGGSEIMYVCNDGDVNIFSNMQNGWDSRKTFTFNTSGNLVMPSGARIGESGGSLYLGNSNNANWVYVQDMASQDSSKWKLTLAGAFTCTSISDSGAATISGGITSQHGHVFNVAGNEFNWIPDGYNSTMWLNYESFNRTNNSTVSEYICGNGKHGQANLRAAKVYNAVWNDFAEYREGTTTEAGRVVAVTTDSNKVSLTTKRLLPCAHVISDTFGCSVGESDTAKTPIGVAGRVLVFPYKPIEEYNIGDCLCAAPGGTADIMSREEIIMYPDRIIGIVDEIPNYEIWNLILTTAKPEDKDKIISGGGQRSNRRPCRSKRLDLDLCLIILKEVA